MTEEVSEAVSVSYITHVLTVGGVVLAVFALARLVSEKRQPSNTLAWILAIILMPYVGVPLYLLLGGRKLRRIAARKRRLAPHLPGVLAVAPATAALPTVHAVCGTGGSPPAGGNTVRLITTGEQAYAELEAGILAARHSIHITTFILSRDDTGRHFVKLLAKRAREGIKVRLLLDAVGCLISCHGFVDPIRKAGGEVVKFMPVVPLSSRGSANLRNHRKIAIFDHRVGDLVRQAGFAGQVLERCVRRIDPSARRRRRAHAGCAGQQQCTADQEPRKAGRRVQHQFASGGSARRYGRILTDEGVPPRGGLPTSSAQGRGRFNAAPASAATRRCACRAPSAAPSRSPAPRR